MKKDPHKILVFQTAFLGDTLLAIPLLKAIKDKWPKATLAIVCRPGVKELFLQGKIVDNVIEVEKRSRKSLRSAFLETQEFNADLILSPHQSFRTALWVARLRAQTKIGFEKRWNFFGFNVRVKYPREKHDVLRQLSLLEPLGVNISVLSDEIKSLHLKIPEEEPPFENYVVLSPGSQWDTKRWTKKGFIDLGRKASLKNYKVVIVGAKNENQICGEIASKVSGAIDLCGQTSILQLAQVLKHSKILFCNDSGTMHVASTVGTPLVAIFGPTVPEQGYSPWNKNSYVAEIKLSCRPCGAHGHQKCPIGTHQCMKDLTSEMVWFKGLSLLTS